MYTDSRLFECRITGYSSVTPLPPRDAASGACDVQRGARIVALADRHLLGAQGAGVFERPQVQRQQHPGAVTGHHVGQLLLRQLESADRPVELDARLAVVDRAFQAIPWPPPWCRRRCRSAPLVEAGQRPGKPPSLRQHGLGGQANLVQHQFDVTDARSDILWWISGALKPDASVGTTKPRMPSSVRAHTTATSAIEPLVIHILVPVSTQSSPSRRACVRIPAGLEPKSGSVRGETADQLTRGHAGQPLLLLLSLPQRQIANMASDPAPTPATGFRNPPPPTPCRPGRAVALVPAQP